MIDKKYLTIEDIAKNLDKSEQTIRRWINIGIYGKTLAATKVGINWRIAPGTLETFLYNLTNGGNSNG